MSQSGYVIDPEAGHVYGRLGKPISKRCGGGYIQRMRTRACPAKMVHRIIWESVYGPIPEGMQINHINGVKDDNRIANLELVTPSENTKHAYRLGLARADGAFNGRSIGKRRRA
jgi:transcriptional regulator CtsR